MSWVGQNIVIDSLRELADQAYQENIWSASSGPEIPSFTEAVCRLFGDSGLDAAFDKGEVVFGKEIDNRLKELGVILQEIPDNRRASEIIQDKKMISVRDRAAHILKLIERKN